jgi:hypothetical protein
MVIEKMGIHVVFQDVIALPAPSTLSALAAAKGAVELPPGSAITGSVRLKRVKARRRRQPEESGYFKAL